MADSRSRVDIAHLVAEHHQAVYRYAYRLTGSVHDAEDLTQQTYLVAQRKMGQLRNLGSARPWLFTILKNCFLKECQKLRPVQAVDLALNTAQAPDDSEEVDRDRLQEALNRLPDIYRLAVVMFYFEECSYRQIAERLAMPIGTVMSRLARAKDRLRSILCEQHTRDEREADQRDGRTKVRR